MDQNRTACIVSHWIIGVIFLSNLISSLFTSKLLCGKNICVLPVLAPGHQQPQYWTLHYAFMSFQLFNTLRLRQNGCHFADNIFKCIFLNENVWIAIQISLKFFPRGPINNIPALVKLLAWHQPGNKPLFEPMMVSLLMHMFHSASVS